MNQSPDFKAAVRRELSLETPNRPRRRLPLLGLAAATALLCSLAAGPAAAQGPYLQEVIRGFSSLLVGGYYSTPSVVDLDGDGDLDVVVGAENGRLYYFENTGSSIRPAFVQVVGSENPFDGIDVVAASSPELVDLDGDGDLEAVVGEYFGILRYFENTGSASIAVFVERAGTASPLNGMDVGLNSRPELVDLDGDGDLDAVIGDYSGALRYFENTGNSSAPGFVEGVASSNPFDGIDVGALSSPDLADLDGDGDLDAVVGLFSSTLRYFENTGSSTVPSFVERTGSANPCDGIDVVAASSPELVDLDGDGDFDAVNGGLDGSLMYFENAGSSSAPAFVAGAESANPLNGIDVGRYSSPDLVDLDGDADLDAVVGGQQGFLRYFRNTGGASVPAFVEETGDANPFPGVDVSLLSNPELVDLDGDGDLDAVVGESAGRLFYFANTGSSIAPAFVAVTGSTNPFDGIDVGSYSTPELVDLDGDGDLDVVVGEFERRLNYFKNTGSSITPAFVEGTGSASPFDGLLFGYLSSPDLVDLDGDGDLDAVVGNNLGALRFFENTGGSTAPAFAQQTGSSNPFDGIHVGYRSSPDLVDLDGDGDLDLLVGEVGGRVAFFRSKANDLFADGFESGDTAAWSLTVPGL